MPTLTTSSTPLDLQGILDLQKRNLPENISREERDDQGFVTVHHSYDDLSKLNSHEQHVIAKEGDQVVGYVLAMTKHSKADIPVLVPMFEVFDQINYKGKPISAYNYIVVGQVCMDKSYRGQGLFSACYDYYREQFHNKYDFAITEIDMTNTRSLRAHEKIGFVEVHRFVDQSGTDWRIVLWQWHS